MLLTGVLKLVYKRFKPLWGATYQDLYTRIRHGSGKIYSERIKIWSITYTASSQRRSSLSRLKEERKRPIMTILADKTTAQTRSTRKPLPKFRALRNTAQHRKIAGNGGEQGMTFDPQCLTNDCPAD